MAVDLSIRRGSVKEVADELGLSHSLLSKWKHRLCEPKQGTIDLTKDLKMIKKLQRALKHDTLKKTQFKPEWGGQFQRNLHQRPKNYKS